MESLIHLLLFIIARKDARILFTYSFVYTYLLFGFVIIIIVWCFVYIFIYFFEIVNKLHDYVSSEKHPS